MLFSGQQLSAQNTPAALRNSDVTLMFDEQTQSPEINEDQSPQEQAETGERKIQLKKKNPLKRLKKKRKGSEFWMTFFGILGFLCFIAAVVAFFFFNTLGWWVALISLGLFLFGFLFLLFGAIAEGTAASIWLGVGAVIAGMAAGIVWLLGVLIIGIIDLVN